MSLAQLFEIKETWRQRMKRARREWLRKRASRVTRFRAFSHQPSALKHSSPITRHFFLESLEPRLLLSATPAELVLPVEGIVEGPNGSGAATVTGEAPTVMVDLGEASGGDAARSTQYPTLVSTYGAIPLSFEANEGQTDPSVKFLSRGEGYTLFLTDTEAVLSLSTPPAVSDQPSALENSALRLTLEGANPSPLASGLAPQEGIVNYLIGNDPDEWHVDIPTYGQVFYDEVYNGIDLLFYGNQRQLEYDWLVAPGADPSQIALGIAGADSLSLTAEDHLHIAMPGGTVELLKPVAYQLIDGARVSVAASYILSTQDSALSTATLSLGSYDPTHELIIDPVLLYATYLGGTGNDFGYDVAVDSSGSAYLSGHTFSTNFPTAGAIDATLNDGVITGVADVFVTKLNAAGTALVYSTYLGGSGADSMYALVVDGSGNAYVAGTTASSDFPTANAFDATHNGGTNDAFVAKLNATGSALVYSTYLGGDGEDSGFGLAVDSSGNAYVSGTTGTSTTFPTTLGAFDTTGNGGIETFVTKLNAAGTALVYSTYLGGIGDDTSRGLALDASGNAYVTGFTVSTDFPTTAGAYDESYNAFNDVFVTKLNAAGSALAYSTYIGTPSPNGNDFGYGIAVDASGNAYVTGFTGGALFPTTPGAFDTTANGGSNAFVTKLNAAGSSLVYSTFLGGSGSEDGLGIAVDAAGNAYVVGDTPSADFPTVLPVQGTYGGGVNDGYLTKLNAAGSALVYSTYLGGSGDDLARGVALDPVGNVYVVGQTSSTNLPTANPFQASTGGGTDAFIVKLSSLVPTAPVTPATNLLSWWTGDNTPNDLINAYNGTLVNGATYTTGKVGQAFSFDGINDNVSVANAAGLGLEGSTYSLSVWIKPSLLKDFGNVFWKAPAALTSGWGLITLANGSWSFQSSAGGWADVVGGAAGSLANGAWTHLAVTYDGTNVRTYTNGVLVTTQARGTIPANALSLIIGADTVNSRYFNGLIDDAQIYTRALSAGEVLGIVNAGGAGQSARVTTVEDTAVPVTLIGSDPESQPLTFSLVTPPAHGTLSTVAPLPLSGIVSQWSAEGNATDTVGTNNGTLFNGATATAGGKVGQSFSINGINDGILVPSSTSLNVGAGNGLTIEAWINPTDISTGRPLVEWNQSGALFEGTHFWIAIPPGEGTGPGSLFANIKDTSGNNHIFSSPGGILTANVFQHVALTYDKVTGIGRMYLEGAQVAQANLGIFTPQTSYNLYIGHRPNDGGAPGLWVPFAGKMDEVGIYNRALSASEVADLVAAGNTTLLRAGSSVDGATVRYTPNADYSGPDSFTYKANDGSLDSAAAVVSLTIIPQSNDGPTLFADTAILAQNSPAALIDVLGNDSDPEQNFLTITAVGPAAHGTTAILDTPLGTDRQSETTLGAQAGAVSGGVTADGNANIMAFWSDASDLVGAGIDTNGARDVFVRDLNTGVTTRVSVATGGTQANAASATNSFTFFSQAPVAVSANGRYVVFDSNATNLVAGDTNGWTDVFVHDRQTGATTRVSVATDGTEGNRNSQGPVSISADGRFVAFVSNATTLAPGKTSFSVADVFVRDRDTDADGIFDEAGAVSTTRVSVSSSGTEGDNESVSPVISADGRHVAFESLASNLVTGDTNLQRDVFVHDRQTGQTIRVSVDASGAEGTNRSRGPLSISADGRYVAFSSEANNLVAGDTGQEDIFVRDRDTDNDHIFDEAGAVSTIRASVNTTGVTANNGSFHPGLSADGRMIVFQSFASDLVAGDINDGVQDIFVRDLLAGQTKRVSLDTGGIAPANNNSSEPVIVPNGGWGIAYTSLASNLIAGDTNSAADIFTAWNPFNKVATYQPTAGFTGVDSFTYTVSDGTLTSSSAALIGVGINAVHAVTNTNDSGPGSLRQAIIDANVSAVLVDAIGFAIAGNGVQTIAPTSALPTITGPVIIDGTTQPGYAGTPLIELSGGNTITNGLVITIGSSTIRGLAINRFTGNGIVVSSLNGNNVIEGNYIGVDAATGSVDLGNGQDGILIIGSPNNRIGGTTDSQRNIISGNADDGIEIQAFGADNNLVIGNFIGINAAGTGILGNSDNGVYLAGPAKNNIIGGTNAAERNVISGNGDGVHIFSGDSTVLGNIVLGNYIGTDVTGFSGLRNTQTGVKIEGAWGNTIGGVAPGAGNTIAFNTGIGVGVATGAGTGNAIQGNAIHSNSGLGIDLGATGVTANDLGDADTGANNLQNFPVLTSVTAGNPVITGTLNSLPNKAYTLEFFSNPAGNSQGQTFLGRTAIATDNNGNAAFTVILSTPVTEGQVVTATATDPNGNTSEFSAGLAVTNGTVASFPLTIKVNGAGSGTITSLPTGINTATADFTETFATGMLVDLTATPDGSSAFVGWSGQGFSSSDTTVTVSMTTGRTLTATFQPSNSINAPTVFEGLLPANEADLYRFVANAGDQLTFDLTTAPAGSTSVIWRLYGPTDNELFSKTWSNTTAADHTLTVTQTGSYTLAIDAPIGNTAGGDYQFAVTRLPGTPTTPATPNYTIGQTVSDSVTNTTPDTYVFTIGGTETKQLLFDSFTNDVDVLWSLSGPQGALVTNRRFDISDGTNSPTAPVLGLPTPGLPPGTYTLTISTAQDAAQAYSFRLLDVASGTVVTPGTTVGGVNLNPGTEIDAYRFDAVAGQRLYFDALTISSGSVWWALFDPFGTRLFGQTAGTSTDVTVDIAQNGTYTLVFDGAVSNPATAINYSFIIRPVVDQTQAIAVAGVSGGVLVSGAISQPIEQDFYTFTLTSQTGLVFDSLTNDGNLTWALAGPSGTVVSATNLSQADGGSLSGVNPVRTLQPGDYTLTIDATGTATGSYQFRLIDIAAAPSIAPGTPKSDTFADAKETDVYRFTAVEGQKYYFDIVARSGATGARWSLVNPQGNADFVKQLFTGNQNQESGPLTLQGGVYTLVLEGLVSESGSGTYTFNVVPIAEEPIVNLTADLLTGAVKTGAIEEPGDVDRYEFTLAQETKIYFDALTDSGGLQWTLNGLTGLPISSYNIVANRAFLQTDGNTALGGTAVYLLPAGTYSLTIDGNLDVTSAYAFRLLDLAFAQSITINTPFGGTIGDLANPSPPPATFFNETEAYKFNATAGDKIYIDIQTSTGTGAVNWRLIDPINQQLFNTSFATTDQGPLTLAETGVYTLLIEGNISNTASRTYTVNVQAVGDEVVGPLPLGSLVQETIEEKGEQDLYSFDLTQTKRVYFDNQTNSVINWTLSGPTGILVSARPFSTDVGANVSILTLRPGHYDLTVKGANDVTNTNYQFRFIDLDDPSLPLLTYDVAQTGSLNQSNAAGTLSNTTDAYHLNATAGDRVVFDVTARAGTSSNEQWFLVDPYSNVVASTGFIQANNDLGSVATPLVLNFTGTYTLLLEGYIANASTIDNTYTFVPDFQSNVPPTIQSDNYTVGTVVRDTVVSGVANNDVYRFTLANESQIAFDALTNTSVNWSLTGPTGLLINGRTFVTSDGSGVGGNPVLFLPAGQYTLTIATSSASSLSYAFRLLDLASAGSNVIVPGTPVSGTFANLPDPQGGLFPAIETDLYQLTTTGPNQSFYFDVTERTNASNAQWRLVDHYNQLMFNGGFGTSLTNGGADRETLTLPLQGTYTLLIEGSLTDSAVTSGSYTFNIVPVTNGAFTITPSDIATGSVKSGAIEEVGERDVYAFSLSQTSRLYFDSLTNNGSLQWSLVGPTGTVVGNRPFSTSDSGNITSLPIPALLPAGTYTLTVDGTFDNGNMPYAFRLVDLDSAQLIAPGATVSGILGDGVGSEVPSMRITPSPLPFATSGQALTFNDTNGRVLVPDSASLRPAQITVEAWVRSNGSVQAGDVVLMKSSQFLTGGYGLYMSSGTQIAFYVSTNVNNRQVAATLPVGTWTHVAGTYDGTNVQFYLNGVPAGATNLTPLAISHSTNSLLIGGDGPTSRQWNGDIDDVRIWNVGRTEGEIAGSMNQVLTGSESGLVASWRFEETSGTAVLDQTANANHGVVGKGHETDLYRFTANAGDKFFFDLLSRGGGVTSYWRLKNPAGTQVFEGDFNSPVSDDQGPLTLPQPGSYTLLIEGKPSQTTPAFYQFNVQPVINGSAPLTLGATVTGAIDEAGEQDIYTFSVTQPTPVAFDSLTNSNSLNWTLAGPTTTLVTSRQFTSTDGNGFNGSPVILLQPGQYRLTIDGSLDLANAPYAFRLIDLNALTPLVRPTLTTPLSIVSNFGDLPNPAAPGNNFAAIETDPYRFTAQAGERFFFDVTARSGAPQARWRLIDPYNQFLFDVQFNDALSSDQELLTLTKTGTYTLLLEGSVADSAVATGSYGVSVVPITDESFALPLNTIMNETIEESGERDRYLFTLAQPTRVFFDSLTNNANLQWTLTGPAGNVITNRAFTSSDGGSISTPMIPLAAGNYTLTIDGVGNLSNTNYGFRLYNLATVPQITPLVPVPTFAEAQSAWPGTLTFSWAPVVPPAGQVLAGYNLYIGYQPGQYGDPIFVPPTNTSITLFDVPEGVQHYFSVTALMVPFGTPLGTPSEALMQARETLLVPLAVVAAPDFYATAKTLQFATVRATGVLANDSGAGVIAGHPSLPVNGGTVVAFNPDGSFIYRPNPNNLTGVDSFTYEVSDNNGVSWVLGHTATIVIAQESGFSVEGTTVPQTGLAAWTVTDEGPINGPSSWSTAPSPEIGQMSGIGTGTADLAQKGTFLLLNKGVSRANVTYTFNVRSSSSPGTPPAQANGALGLMFRYQDANNYYRFSMDNEQGELGGYRRLVKVQNGSATTLWSEPVPANQPAYFPDTLYTLIVDANGPTLTVAVTLGDGTPVFTRSVTDATTPLLTGRGYALYSEQNAGSYFEYVGAEVNATSYQLEVRTGGTGGGTVSSSPTAIVTPGASVVTYDSTTGIQLTAQPGPGSTFQQWTNEQGQVLGTSATLSLSVTSQTIVTANFTGTPAPLQTLDIDGNNRVEPLKDGLLILRYLSGFTGTALTSGLLGQGATRTNPADILSYLNQAKTTLLDVDGNINGTTITEPEPLKDGLLILRYLSGFSGDNLTAGLLGQGARRLTPLAVQNFLSLYDLDPLTNPVSPTSESAVLPSATPLVMPSDWAWNDLFASVASASPIGANPADRLTGVTAFRTDPRFATIDGDGMTAVLIDTGIDVDHPFFGPDQDQNGIADRIVYQWDFADGDADASDRNGHGSHIASLIASEDPTYPGVVPDANLIILKVFRDSGTGTVGYLEQALQWVIAHAADYSIDVVNLSLGDGQNWTTPVNPYGLADEFAALANNDILTIAASGNSFFTAQSVPGVTYPAADPNVLAIGAVWTQDFGGPWRFGSGATDLTTGPDRLASFTQRHAQLLDALAPGARLTGANAFGGTQLLQGTSQAAAYFSGLALLAQETAQQEQGRALTPSEFIALVRETGRPVLDGDDEQDNVLNTGLTFPRVDLLALAERLFRNDAPSFTPGADQTVNEDSGLQTIVDWATGISAGAANETAQTVRFTVTTTAPALFSAVPTVSPTGTLTYTPAADAHGTATIHLWLTDDGGTANGGVDRSAPQTVTITVNPVNDAPRGTPRTLTLDEDASHTFSAADFGFTDPLDSPANQLQAVTLTTLPESGRLRLDHRAVAVGQTIAAADLDRLTYRPKLKGEQFLVETLAFVVQDDGGAARGGVDRAVAPSVLTLRIVDDADDEDDRGGKGRGAAPGVRDGTRTEDDARGRRPERRETGAVMAATQLSHAAAPWVASFVRHGAVTLGDEDLDEDLVVRL